jgi:hypothetical protein
MQPAFGIASGHVFVGRSGSLTRCEYTTSGADVILAGPRRGVAWCGAAWRDAA